MKINEVNNQVVIYRDSRDIIHPTLEDIHEFYVSDEVANELRAKYKGGDYWALTIGTWNDKFPEEYEWEMIEDDRAILRTPVINGTIKHENNTPILALYSEREFN